MSKSNSNPNSPLNLASNTTQKKNIIVSSPSQMLNSPGVQTRSRKNSAKVTPTRTTLESLKSKKLASTVNNQQEIVSSNVSLKSKGIQKGVRRSKRGTLKKSMETIRKG